ncbi:MAG: hypothetical protein AB1801_24335 [Chloroflexota bacterium]
MPKALAASLLNWAGSSLRGLGRLDEARQPLAAALNAFSAQKQWQQAAIAAANLSQLLLALGHIDQALACARTSIAHAHKSRDEFQQLAERAAEAEALHQAGRLDQAAAALAEVEQRQQQLEPAAPRLSARPGYQYCDLLLSRGQIDEVKARAEQTLALAQAQGWTLAGALDRLALGRAYLAGSGQVDLQTAGAFLDKACEGLQQERALEYLVPAWLARAEWFQRQGRWSAAQADIFAALELAGRTGMKLFACDAHLAQARLALAQGSPESARAPLDQARALIQATGYGRREQEAAALETTFLT